jgi:hypothetical protein
VRFYGEEIFVFAQEFEQWHSSMVAPMCCVLPGDDSAIALVQANSSPDLEQQVCRMLAFRGRRNCWTYWPVGAGFAACRTDALL